MNRRDLIKAAGAAFAALTCNVKLPRTGSEPDPAELPEMPELFDGNHGVKPTGLPEGVTARLIPVNPELYSGDLSVEGLQFSDIRPVYTSCSGEQITGRGFCQASIPELLWESRDWSQFCKDYGDVLRTNNLTIELSCADIEPVEFVLENFLIAGVRMVQSEDCMTRARDVHSACTRVTCDGENLLIGRSCYMELHPFPLEYKQLGAKA